MAEPVAFIHIYTGAWTIVGFHLNTFPDTRRYFLFSDKWCDKWLTILLLILIQEFNNKIVAIMPMEWDGESIRTCEGKLTIFIFSIIYESTAAINRCTIHNVELFLNLVVGRCTGVPISYLYHICAAMYLLFGFAQFLLYATRECRNGYLFWYLISFIGGFCKWNAIQTMDYVSGRSTCHEIKFKRINMWKAWTN